MAVSFDLGLRDGGRGRGECWGWWVSPGPGSARGVADPVPWGGRLFKHALLEAFQISAPHTSELSRSHRGEGLARGTGEAGGVPLTTTGAPPSFNGHPAETTMPPSPLHPPPATLHPPPPLSTPHPLDIVSRVIKPHLFIPNSILYDNSLSHLTE